MWCSDGSKGGAHSLEKPGAKFGVLNPGGRTLPSCHPTILARETQDRKAPTQVLPPVAEQQIIKFSNEFKIYQLCFLQYLSQTRNILLL